MGREAAENGQTAIERAVHVTNRTTRGTRLGEALGACLFSFSIGRLSFFAYLCSDKQEARRPAVQERAARTWRKNVRRGRRTSYYQLQSITACL